MNLELWTTIGAIKYLFKYVYKNNNCAKVALEDRNNEIKFDLLSQ